MLCMSGLCLDIEPLTHDRPVCAKKSSVNVTKGLKKDITALSGSLRWSCAPCLCFSIDILADSETMSDNSATTMGPSPK